MRNHLRVEIQQKLYESELQDTIDELTVNLREVSGKARQYEKVMRL